MHHLQPPPLPEGVDARPCPGLPGYAVTINREVLSCKLRNPRGTYGRWRLMRTSRPSEGKIGYETITACVDGLRIQRSVHSLVLEAYVGPCPSGMECRHLDGDQFNNRLDNLCWGTPSDNKRDVVRHGRCAFSRRGEAASRAKFSDETIARARRMIAAGEPYRSITAATGISAPYLSEIKGGVYRA